MRLRRHTLNKVFLVGALSAVLVAAPLVAQASVHHGRHPAKTHKRLPGTRRLAPVRAPAKARTARAGAGRTTQAKPNVTVTAKTSTGAPLRDRALIGVGVDSGTLGPTELSQDEAMLGAHVDIASIYSDWTHVLGGAQERALAGNGSRTVLASWEPWGLTFADVYSGREDAYLGAVAQAMRGYPGNLYVRPWPEMNALWSAWQPGSTKAGSAGSVAEFIQAWRYLVDYFRSRGVTNLKFVFNVDSSDFPQNTRVPAIWPGASYVDVLGIDGYNWGNSALGAIDTGDRWREFTTIFGPMYTILTGLDPRAPVWVTEVGSKEPTIEDDWNYPKESSPVDPSHDKGAWIHNALSTTLFPQLSGVVFFNKKKERDWRLNSSASALLAIQQELAARKRSGSTAAKR